MKELINYINEVKFGMNKEKIDISNLNPKIPYLRKGKSEDTFMIIHKGNIYNYKGKYILLCGDNYEWHMKSWNYDDVEKINLHTHSDKDWDLSEIYYSDDKKELEKVIKCINEDRYFREYSGYFKFTKKYIIDVNKITKDIKIWEKKH